MPTKRLISGASSPTALPASSDLGMALSLAMKSAEQGLPC